MSPVDEALAVSRIQVGTARMAEGDKILTALSDADFVDNCVLNAAHKLGSPEGTLSTVRVVIHLNVDALAEELKLWPRPDVRATDELFEFYARLHEKPYPMELPKFRGRSDWVNAVELNASSSAARRCAPVFC